MSLKAVQNQYQNGTRIQSNAVMLHLTFFSFSLTV